MLHAWLTSRTMFPAPAAAAAAANCSSWPSRLSARRAARQPRRDDTISRGRSESKGKSGEHSTAIAKRSRHTQHTQQQTTTTRTLPSPPPPFARTPTTSSGWRRAAASSASASPPAPRQRLQPKSRRRWSRDGQRQDEGAQCEETLAIRWRCSRRPMRWRPSTREADRSGRRWPSRAWRRVRRVAGSGRRHNSCPGWINRLRIDTRTCAHSWT